LLLGVQDVIFGSEGTAQADFERMEEINREIGLTAMLQDMEDGSNSPTVAGEKKDEVLAEKRDEDLAEKHETT
jgi:hypothetical protein